MFRLRIDSSLSVYIPLVFTLTELTHCLIRTGEALNELGRSKVVVLAEVAYKPLIWSKDKSYELFGSAF